MLSKPIAEHHLTDINRATDKSKITYPIVTDVVISSNIYRSYVNIFAVV